MGCCFNPLPPPKRGEICCASGTSTAIEDVSIRSPRRSEGRCGSGTIPVDGAERGEFQSAPPAEARGDNAALRHRLDEADMPFQSAPPAEARGRFENPPSSRARLTRFQSAPPAEARGDLGVTSRSTNERGFNPLPPPKRGEIRSITAGVWRRPCGFQSAPPAEARGDRRARSRCSSRCWFQSAPPAEARGDAGRRCSLSIRSSFNPLPPPKRGEMRITLSAVEVTWRFQSAPPAEARGD